MAHPELVGLEGEEYEAKRLELLAEREAISLRASQSCLRYRVSSGGGSGVVSHNPHKAHADNRAELMEHNRVLLNKMLKH